MNIKIEQSEVDDFIDNPPACPFCEKTPIELDENGSIAKLDACPHLLFYCHDLAWEFLSERAKVELQRKGLKVDDRDKEFIEVFGENVPGLDCGDSPDCITNELEIPGAIKLATYEGPPSLYGTYIGFAPLKGNL